MRHVSSVGYLFVCIHLLLDAIATNWNFNNNSSHTSKPIGQSMAQARTHSTSVSLLRTIYLNYISAHSYCVYSPYYRCNWCRLFVPITGKCTGHALKVRDREHIIHSFYLCSLIISHRFSRSETPLVVTSIQVRMSLIKWRNDTLLYLLFYIVFEHWTISR